MFFNVHSWIVFCLQPHSTVAASAKLIKTRRFVWKPLRALLATPIYRFEFQTVHQLDSSRRWKTQISWFKCKEVVCLQNKFNDHRNQPRRHTNSRVGINIKIWNWSGQQQMVLVFWPRNCESRCAPINERCWHGRCRPIFSSLGWTRGWNSPKFVEMVSYSATATALERWSITVEWEEGRASLKANEDELWQSIGKWTQTSIFGFVFQTTASIGWK